MQKIFFLSIIMCICGCKTSYNSADHYADHFRDAPPFRSNILKYHRGGVFFIGRHGSNESVVPQYIFQDTSIHLVAYDLSNWQTISFTDHENTFLLHINSDINRLDFGMNLLDTNFSTPLLMSKNGHMFGVAKKDEITFNLQFFERDTTGGLCRSRADITGYMHFVKKGRILKKKHPICGSVFALPFIIGQSGSTSLFLCDDHCIAVTIDAATNISTR